MNSKRYFYSFARFFHRILSRPDHTWLTDHSINEVNRYQPLSLTFGYDMNIHKRVDVLGCFFDEYSMVQWYVLQ